MTSKDRDRSCDVTVKNYTGRELGNYKPNAAVFRRILTFLRELVWLAIMVVQNNHSVVQNVPSK